MLVKSSKIINKLIDSLVALLLALLIIYSTYSLYSSYMMFKGAYISNQILELKPRLNEEIDMGIDFTGIRKINKDVKAWIQVDNTHINYPVVQGEDNLEYVNKNIYGEFAFEGAIFLDSRNNPNFEDPYTLIYGHHMENGAMLGDLELFKNERFFYENTTASLTTEQGERDIKIFAIVEADGYDELIFNPSWVSNKDEKTKLLNYIEKKKIHMRQVDMEESDRVIALSTCTSTKTNGRTLVFGIISDKGEEK